GARRTSAWRYRGAARSCVRLVAVVPPPEAPGIGVCPEGGFEGGEFGGTRGVFVDSAELAHEGQRGGAHVVTAHRLGYRLGGPGGGVLGGGERARGRVAVALRAHDVSSGWRG